MSSFQGRREGQGSRGGRSGRTVWSVGGASPVGLQTGLGGGRVRFGVPSTFLCAAGSLPVVECLQLGS